MPRLPAVLARVVLAAAVATTIATSPPRDGWQLQASAPTALGTVDDASPQLAEALHAELRDWGPGGVDGGLLAVRVTVGARGTGAGTATGRVVLQAPGQPAQTVGYAIAAGELQRVDLDVPVFGSCPANPCTSDASLTIERDFQDGDPAVAVTIDATVDANGIGHQPPDGTLKLSIAPKPR